MSRRKPMGAGRPFHAAVRRPGLLLGWQQAAVAVRLQPSMVRAWHFVTLVWMVQLATVPFRAVRTEEVSGKAVRIDDLPRRRGRRARGFEERLVGGQGLVKFYLLFFPFEILLPLFFSPYPVFFQRFFGTPDLFFTRGRERNDTFDGDGSRSRLRSIADVAVAVDGLVDRFGRYAA